MLAQSFCSEEEMLAAGYAYQGFAEGSHLRHSPKHFILPLYFSARATAGVTAKGFLSRVTSWDAPGFAAKGAYLRLSQRMWLCTASKFATVSLRLADLNILSYLGPE